MLGGLAFVSRCSYALVRINFCIYFIDRGISTFRAENDNKQINSQTEFDSRSGFYNEQDRMPIHIFIYAFR
jgi:hypothetical protein